MAIANTPAIGPSPNAMTKIRANTIDGTVRANSSARRTTKRSHGAGKEIERKGQRRAGQRADIADQDRLGEQLEPLLPAPEPFTEVGPDPGLVIQRQDAVEIADEVSKVGDEGLEIHLGADRGHDQGDNK